MNRIEHANGVVTLGFEKLAGLPIQGHVVTRHGGVSPAPWQSLNFSVARGDAQERVHENRRRLADALDFDVAHIVRCQQVHGTRVCAVDKEQAGQVQEDADALVTAGTELPISLVFADCVPVLLYDAERHVVGICHAGWRGTVAGSARSTLETMQRVHKTNPAHVHVGIGPSIGPDSYEVGPEVVAAAKAGLPYAEECLLYPRRSEGRAHFDLWRANQLQLEAAGVPASQIEIASIDTARNTQDFFSHRAEKGRCGLFCMVAWLEPKTV